MRTSAEYLSDLRKMKVNAYQWGKKVKQPIVDDPQIRTNYNAAAIAYDAALDPTYKELMTVIEPSTGNRVSRFAYLYQSTDDLLIRLNALRTVVSEFTCPCICRCAGIDGLMAMSIVTYDTDQALGTNYHERFMKYFRYYQERDLMLAGAVTDAKGDRSLRPHQQADPDLYVRVVEKRKDGIIVRGSKQSITSAVVSDELAVIPSRGLTEKDADYAVAFCIPTDTEGVTLVNVAKSTPGEKKMEMPSSRQFAFSDAVIIFDNVFVPWDRVFMCGEWQFAGGFGSLFGNYHRFSHCGCIPGRAEVLLGAASLIAKYNGVRDKGHIKDKIADLVVAVEMSHACGVTAAVRGRKTPSGIYIPDVIYSNIGKYYHSMVAADDAATVVDIAGGLLFTMPSEADYFLPELNKSLEKYLKGVAYVNTEDRIKIFRLIEDMIATRWGSCLTLGEVVGAGPPQAQKIGILADFDMEKREALAKRAANISS